MNNQDFYNGWECHISLKEPLEISHNPSKAVDTKPRRPFALHDADGNRIGHGVAYEEGNVQVYMKPHDAAWQMQLDDVLKLKGVKTFRWSDKRA